MSYIASGILILLGLAAAFAAGALSMYWATWDQFSSNFEVNERPGAEE